MKNKILAIMALLTSFSTYSGLQSLDNQELDAIQGQAGADLSLNLQLNQTASGAFDTTICTLSACAE